jgi:hypothetical protein
MGRRTSFNAALARVLLIIQRESPIVRLNRNAKQHPRQRKIGGPSFLDVLQYDFAAFH